MTGVRTPGWQRVVAGSGLLLTSPVLAASAVAIKLSSPGPVFYRSMRAGRLGEPFAIRKLRTMHAGSDLKGAITAADDQRIFPAGRWIRRLKIDELPQLANVLCGEMALVGPRPESMEIVETAYDPWMLETLDVPPGITGPGSLHYVRQDQELPGDPAEAHVVYVKTLLPKKLALELTYVRSRSFAYEIQLIVRTIAAVFGAPDIMNGVAERELSDANKILQSVSGKAAW